MFSIYSTFELRWAVTKTHVFSGFIAIGTLFDVAVWFRVKDLKIFDDELRIEMTPNVTEQIEAELKELL